VHDIIEANNYLLDQMNGYLLSATKVNYYVLIISR